MTHPVRLLLCCLAFLGPSCVSLKPLHTISGNPEVVVRTAKPDRVLRAIGAAMARRDYRTLLQNERLAVFTKPCKDFDTAFFYGDGWNASADFRVTLFLSQEPGGLRVLTDLELVTRAGTAEEGLAPAPQGHPEAHALQDMLELLVADLALQLHEEQWPDEPQAPPGSAPPVWTGTSSGGS